MTLYRHSTRDDSVIEFNESRDSPGKHFVNTRVATPEEVMKMSYQECITTVDAVKRCPDHNCPYRCREDGRCRSTLTEKIRKKCFPDLQRLFR